MDPVDGVSIDEAADILGCSPAAVRRRVLQGFAPVSRADVEELASDVYRWRDHLDVDRPYWVTSSQAAVILGVVRKRVRQLSERDLLASLWHRDGIRLYRREQLAIVAQGRSVLRPGGTGTRRMRRRCRVPRRDRHRRMAPAEKSTHAGASRHSRMARGTPGCCGGGAATVPSARVRRRHPPARAHLPPVGAR